MSEQKPRSRAASLASVAVAGAILMSVTIAATLTLQESITASGGTTLQITDTPTEAATEAVAVSPPGPTSYRVPSIERDLSAVRASTRRLSANAQQVAATPAPAATTTPVATARAASQETQSNEAETEAEGRGESDD